MASLDATAFIPTGVQLEEFFSKKKTRLLHQLIATHHLLFLSCLVFVGESAENREKTISELESDTNNMFVHLFLTIHFAVCIVYRISMVVGAIGTVSVV